MSGNTSYAGYVRTMALNDKINYDLAIICYGQNDAEENFLMYYESIIRAISSKYSKCSIISILESSQRSYTPKMKIIQSLAKYYDIPVVDTIAPFKKKYTSLTNKDMVHPNDKGHEMYAECLLKSISKSVKLNKGFSNYKKSPVNSGVLSFNQCTYISKSKFTKKGLTYTLKTRNSGILGIDYSLISGENRVYCTMGG